LWAVAEAVAQPFATAEFLPSRSVYSNGPFFMHDLRASPRTGMDSLAPLNTMSGAYIVVMNEDE